MKVDVFYLEGCGNAPLAFELLNQIITEHNIEASVKQVEVKSMDDAHGLRFFGSPTIQVNGRDIDPSLRDRTDFVFG